MVQARLSTGFRLSCADLYQTTKAVQSRCHPASRMIKTFTNHSHWLAIYIKAKGNLI